MNVKAIGCHIYYYRPASSWRDHRCGGLRSLRTAHSLVRGDRVPRSFHIQCNYQMIYANTSFIHLPIRDTHFVAPVTLSHVAVTTIVTPCMPYTPERSTKAQSIVRNVLLFL